MTREKRQNPMLFLCSVDHWLHNQLKKSFVPFEKEEIPDFDQVLFILSLSLCTAILSVGTGTAVLSVGSGITVLSVGTGTAILSVGSGITVLSVGSGITVFSVGSGTAILSVGTGIAVLSSFDFSISFFCFFFFWTKNSITTIIRTATIRIV